MRKVQILSYSEHKFIISSEVTPDMLQRARVGVGITPRLLYRPGTDVVGVQLRIAYLADERSIMEYEAIFSILIEGWNEFAQGHPDDDSIREITYPAWNMAIGFARAAIYANAAQRESALARYFLPDVDWTEFMKTVRIDKQLEAEH